MLSRLLVKQHFSRVFKTSIFKWRCSKTCFAMALIYMSITNHKNEPNSICSLRAPETSAAAAAEISKTTAAHYLCKSSPRNTNLILISGWSEHFQCCVAKLLRVLVRKITILKSCSAVPQCSCGREPFKPRSCFSPCPSYVTGIHSRSGEEVNHMNIFVGLPPTFAPCDKSNHFLMHFDLCKLIEITF